ncbi:MAG TPA: MYXO-CTERM sorting domain-containing protein [Polyangiaceae bacterium]
MSKSRSLFRLFLTLVASLMLVLTAASALAAGRIEWKSKNFKERSDKSWMLELKMYLPRAPDVAYVPMKFEFEPLVYFERALVDGAEGPQERKVPLEGRQPLIESVDVGFLDAGTSKIESRTKFSFKVKRDLGYDAGEYKVTVRDTRNGQIVGTATNITFDGENEIIDRRSIVFQGGDKDKKKKKEDAKKDDGGEKKDDEAKKDEGGDESKAEGKSEGSDEGDKSEGGGDEGPPPIEEKPGGCGCRVPAASPHGSLTLLASLALGAVFFARRRSARP